MTPKNKIYNLSDIRCITFQKCRLTAIRYENHAETIRLKVFTLSIRYGFNVGMKSYPVQYVRSLVLLFFFQLQQCKNSVLKSSAN